MLVAGRAASNVLFRSRKLEEESNREN